MGFFVRDDDSAGRPVTASAAVAVGPSRHHARSVAYNSPRPLVASAERISVGALSNVTRTYQAWQQGAWIGYERVGEIHFGFNLLANLLSRVRIYAAAIGKANEAPVDLGQDRGRERVDPKLADAATAVMRELTVTDFPNLIRSFSLNMSVAGECYLVKLDGKNEGASRWSVRSTDEIQVRQGGVSLVPMRNASREVIILPAGTYVARIWRQNPRYSLEPDSSMVGVADSIEELLMLQRLVRSATRSRLNAGMLFVPDGIASGASSTHTAEPPIDEPTDPLTALASSSVTDPGGAFMADLMESMTAPITDEGAASSVVPLLATGPGDLGQQIRHVTFERPSDQWLVDRIEKIINRILQGIDMPKEIVTGLQHVRYSNAVVIDEGLYKSNIEPLALTFVDALTDVYLRQALLAQGFTPEQAESVVVWYDPSEIVTRPNSADEATQGTDRGLLSPAAWRREHGYPETDGPTEVEKAQLLLSKMATLPDVVLVKLLQQAYPDILGDVELPAAPNQSAPPSDGLAHDGETVVQFPSKIAQAQSQPTADPQRTAVKQVGLS